MNASCTADVKMRINANPERVWTALTDPNEIRKYLFGTTTITNWQVGGPIRFVGEWDGKPYEDKGSVLAVEHLKLIRFTYWSSMSGLADVPENYVVVTYQLESDNGNTNFTLTQENCRSEEARQHAEENWAMAIGTLKRLAESKP